MRDLSKHALYNKTSECVSGIVRVFVTAGLLRTAGRGGGGHVSGRAEGLALRVWVGR